MTQIAMESRFRIEEVVQAVLAALQPEPREPEIKAPEVTTKAYQGYEDYPDTLQARHVKEILGVSEAFAYQILNSAKCPTLRMGGKRMVVNKESFLRFLKESEGQNLLG